MTPQALAIWAVGVLQLIVIALITWNLTETVALGKADSAAAVLNAQQDRHLEAQDSRIDALEVWRYTMPVRR